MTQAITPNRVIVGYDGQGNAVYSPVFDSGLQDGQGNHLFFPAYGPTEPNTGTQRAVPRPYDVLGAYIISAESGIMAAGLAANAPVFSMRWAPGVSSPNLALVHRVQVAIGNAGTAFTAGLGSLNLFVARSFTASASGGTAQTLTGNNAKLRTSFATSQVADMRISSTATLTAGTRTLDAVDIGLAGFAVSTAVNNTILPLTDILARQPGDGDWPLVLANNEGFEIQATVPATGTWFLQVVVDWMEVASF